MDSNIVPFDIVSNCVMDDATLYEHIRLAMERKLPTAEFFDPRQVVVLVGSGPSVKGELESIRKQREEHCPIVAIKDAHDWLISEGVIPDYAVAVDPQAHRWNCFRKKDARVRYLIASQCHPAMFEHLSDMNVTLWHLYIRKGQTYPANSQLVTGGTTTGLRAITLFYAMGYRKFHLYGYDCCLKDGALRFDDLPTDKQHVTIVCGGKRFISTPEMAAQAKEFQELFAVMPDVSICSSGEGIITTIIEERGKAAPHFAPLPELYNVNP